MPICHELKIGDIGVRYVEDGTLNFIFLVQSHNNPLPIYLILFAPIEKNIFFSLTKFLITDPAPFPAPRFVPCPLLFRYTPLTLFYR